MPCSLLTLTLSNTVCSHALPQTNVSPWLLACTVEFCRCQWLQVPIADAFSKCWYTCTVNIQQYSRSRAELQKQCKLVRWWQVGMIWSSCYLRPDSRKTMTVHAWVNNHSQLSTTTTRIGKWRMKTCHHFGIIPVTYWDGLQTHNFTKNTKENNFFYQKARQRMCVTASCTCHDISLHTLSSNTVSTFVIALPKCTHKEMMLSYWTRTYIT